jgi:filamentous hemagglutinin
MLIQNKTVKKIIAQIIIFFQLCSLCLSSPLSWAAQALSIKPAAGAVAGQKPMMDAAANGVPIVLIAPPSAGGVSRNQFDQFNVNSQGLILNNSKADALTQLGGWVKGNLQFGTNTAKIIVNEVVQNNATHLLGGLEVAGSKADVIIANPNGILCNGCQFLNTSRVTLGTGQVQYATHGGVLGLNVSQGQINVGDLGLNASGLAQLDLLARGVVLEGAISADNKDVVLNQLNIITGRNVIDYANLRHTVQSGNGVAPPFAVDIKALGGMYANQIYLVSSEAGLGVNSTGRVVALVGDVNLNTQGDVTLKDTYAKRNIQIESAGNVTLTGDTVSDGATRLMAQQDINQQGVLDASQALSMQANNIYHSGSILARSGEAAHISAHDTLTNSGLIYSEGETHLQGGTVNDVNGNIQSVGSVNWVADNVNLSGTTIVTNANANINVGDALNVNETNLQARGDVVINANTLMNVGGTIQTPNHLTINTIKNASNTGGRWLAEKAVTIRAGSVRNENSPLEGFFLPSPGVIASNTLVSIMSQGDVDNAGVISSQGNVLINTNGHGLNNTKGTLVAEQGLNLSVSEINNTEGKLVSYNSESPFMINTGNINNTQGLIRTVGDLALEVSGGITNQSGMMVSMGALSVRGEEINNQDGVMNSEVATQVVGGMINNSNGEISATKNTENSFSTGNVSIQTRDKMLNNQGGLLLAEGVLEVQAGEVNNQALGEVKGRMSAAKNVSLTVASMNNTGGLIQAGQDIVIQSEGDVRNTNGQMFSQGSMNIRAANLSQTGNATLSSGGDMRLEVTNEIIQGGSLSSLGQIDIIAAGLDHTGGKTVAQGNVSLNVSGQLKNNAGQLHTHKQMNISAQEIDNAGGQVVALESAVINATGNVVNDQNGEVKGLIYSSQGLTITAQDVSNQGGGMSSEGDVTIHARNLLNDQQGTQKSIVTTSKNLTLNVNEVSNIGSEISAGKEIKIIARKSMGSDSIDFWKILSYNAIFILKSKIWHVSHAL